LPTSRPRSPPYLAFLVGLHVATALALLVFFRAPLVRIVRGLASSIARPIARRRVELETAP
jgi:undecaprenyl-diphosphatase